MRRDKMNDYEWWRRYRDEDKNACIWFERLDEYERKKLLKECEKIISKPDSQIDFVDVLINITVLINLLAAIVTLLPLIALIFRCYINI